MTSRAYFDVSVFNRNPLWAVCDLAFYVDYSYRSGAQQRIYWFRTEPTRIIAYLAPGEQTEADLLGEGNWSSLVEFGIVAEWSWC